ncbi:MAG: transcription termination factor Rho [Clostridia bacterium]|nr:transcription termination factor Rho [Clostridia bacterium]
MREAYEEMTVLELRKVAKDKGVKLGAGISKQGIIDKLMGTEAQDVPAAESAPVSFSAPQPAAPASRYSASIITDEESDDIPVLTPNPSANLIPRKPITRPAAPAPQSGTSSLSSISSKAPAFTMEGSRAWHNPSSYQTQPAYQSRPQSRPSYAAGERYGAEQRPQPDSRYNTRSMQRPDARYQRPQSAYQQSSYQVPGRFGPDLSAQEPPVQNEYQPVEQQPASGAYRTEYPARAQQDFIPPTAPEYNRRDPYAAAARENIPAGAPGMQDVLMAGECGDGAGVLDVHPEGYGFLRGDSLLPGRNDVYVSNAQIRRFNLRSGDYVAGKTRPQQPGSRYSALLYITEINGQQPEETAVRPAFDQLTALYPKKRMAFGKETDLFLRAVDTLCPIGFGQRALIQVPPRAGRTTLIKKMAAAVKKHHPDAHIMTLLIDERPEDVVDMKESLPGDVLHSAFDSSLESHIRVSELTMERAQRLVEQKQHVVVFIDSMTRLCRACNALAPQSSRTLPSGLALGGLSKAKKLFGAARNTREGGSLTVIALFETDTQSTLDEAILQEFRGTANMELSLERIPGEKHMIPCVNAHRAATRHDELLLTPEEMVHAASIREQLKDIPSRTAQALTALLEK